MTIPVYPHDRALSTYPAAVTSSDVEFRSVAQSPTAYRTNTGGFTSQSAIVLLQTTPPLINIQITPTSSKGSEALEYP